MSEIRFKSLSILCLQLLGHIYLTGGTSDNENEDIHTRTVSCYSIKSENWFTLSPMNHARSSHVTIAHGKSF